MHSTDVASNNVPAFLTKLWKLVEDKKCDHLIGWGENGLTFVIRKQSQFAKELLPLYFKHSNMASFIRQLNMYGFRKIVNIEQGGLKTEKDEMEFQHQYFLRENEHLLSHIKRKLPAGKAPEETKVKTDVNKMQTDMQQLKDHQETMDLKFLAMERKNEALWREIAVLRQKHSKQQQIVNKLIEFLITLVHPNRGLATKRKLPLMLNDTSHTRDIKKSNFSRSFSYDAEKTEGASSVFNPGAVIHDVTDLKSEDRSHDSCTFETPPDKLSMSAVDDPVMVSAAVDIPTTSNLQGKETITKEKLSSFIESTHLEVELNPEYMSKTMVEKEIPLLECALTNAIDDGADMLPMDLDSSYEVALLSSDGDHSQTAMNDMPDPIDSMKTKLELWRDRLDCNGFNFNSSTIFELINSDDSLAGSSYLNEFLNDDKNEINGTELIQYNPSLAELADDDTEFFNLDPDSLPSNDSCSNMESVFPETVTLENELTTPDPILSSPNLFPTRRQGRAKKK